MGMFCGPDDDIEYIDEQPMFTSYKGTSIEEQSMLTHDKGPATNDDSLHKHYE